MKMTRRVDGLTENARRILPLAIFTLTLAIGLTSALAAKPQNEDRLGEESLGVVFDMVIRDRYAPADNQKEIFLLKGTLLSGQMLTQSSGDGGVVQLHTNFSELPNDNQQIFARLNGQNVQMVRLVQLQNQVAAIPIGHAQRAQGPSYKITREEMNRTMKERFAGAYTNALMTGLISQLKETAPEYHIGYVQSTEYLSGYTCGTKIPTLDIECVAKVRIVFAISLQEK